MRVIFLISSVSSDNTGMGGHYYSARSIADVLNSSGIDVRLVVLGDSYPKAYDDIKDEVTFIEFSRFGYISFFRRIKQLFEDVNPDVIHSFDNKSYFVARVFSLILKYRLVLTKPGGPNPRTFFPYCKDLILFSAENHLFFENKRKFKDCRITRIPNRVSPFATDWDRVNSIKKSIPVNKKIVLRIGRIGEDYSEVIKQTGNLIRYLRECGIDSVGIIIGVVQNEKILESLKLEYLTELLFYTDEFYTRNAASLIELSSVIVGTGRSLMEGACKSRILLTTLKGYEYPVFVDESNFAELLTTNFSPRNHLECFDKSLNVKKLTRVLTDDIAFKEAVDFSKRVAIEYFDLSAAVELYVLVYNSAKPESLTNIIDVMLNSVTFIRYYLPITRLAR